MRAGAGARAAAALLEGLPTFRAIRTMLNEMDERLGEMETRLAQAESTLQSVHRIAQRVLKGLPRQ